jgi:hypothetical protein
MRGTCESAEHRGDPLVDRRDLLERRIEWRRLTDQGREHVRIVRRECKACAARELGASRKLEPELEGQEALL